MRVRLRSLLPLGLVVLLAACGGSGASGEAETPTVSELTLRTAVADAAKRAGLAAEARYGAKVRVEQDGNWVDVVVSDSYPAYRSEPERRGEIVAGLVADARMQLERRLDGESFADVRPDLMPLLKPRFSIARLEPAPARTRFLKNLVVAYAVQREHSFFYVREGDLERWGRTPADVHPIALENLGRETEELLCEEDLCGWASGDGYDATRMLVPELRRDVEREIGRAAYAVPMEHVFVAVPIAYAQRIREKVRLDFVRADNPVSPDVFVERGGRLVPLPS